jgi:hypothetical protein
MDASAPRVAFTRWRWRMRGAWQWPAFALFMVADIVLLHELPIWSDGIDFGSAFVIAGAVNLAVVAVLAPVGGLLVRRRRPDLPRFIASNDAGAMLLVIAFMLLLGVGIAHHPAVAAAHREFRAQSLAVRRFVVRYGPPAYRRDMDLADTLKLAAHLYRTCVPAAGSDRALCFFIDTSRTPLRLTRDPNTTPNARYAGGAGPGMLGG